jgi:hydroxymethylbilane synthase
MSTIRIGTRGSKLALIQANLVADALTASSGHDVELVEITTHGDTSNAPLTQIGGTGVFVSALRDALLDGRVDVAVHSLKDLPTAPAVGLVVAAIPGRADPRDALCARDGLTLGELPAGSKIGTGAPRRAAQIAALGLGVDVVPVRGNVDTRLGKVADGSLDAVVLARAGLDRLSRTAEITETLDPVQVLPAPGQGALAVECRAGDDVQSLLAALDDPDARSAVTAERSLLAALEAGCTAPIGALADVADEELYLRAVVASPDGSVSIRKSAFGTPSAAEQLGRDLAAEMLADGAGAVVGAFPRAPEKEIST